MKITVEGQAYEWDEESAENTDIIAIEDATGLTVAEWSEALARGSMRAVTALVWMLRRNNGEPDLALTDVRFRVGSIAIDDDEGKGEEA